MSKLVKNRMDYANRTKIELLLLCKSCSHDDCFLMMGGNIEESSEKSSEKHTCMQVAPPSDAL
jgi:hypothetical protein